MDKKEKVMKGFVKYILIALAAAVYSIGISFFQDPNNLAPGGMSGVSIILSYMTGIKTGTWFFLINIPLVIIAIWQFGFRFIVSTFYAVAVISFFTNIFSSMPPITTNPLLAAIWGGVLVAIGMGIIFKSGATTGGTDIIVKLLRNKFRHLKTGNIFLLTDAIIVAISGIIFSDVDKALYASITIVINSMVLDLILYGRDEAKMVFIISDDSKSIANSIMNELEVGVTYLKGEGAYTKTNKEVIFSVLKKQQYPNLEEIVKSIDSNAFLIVGSASEIYGEGYKNIYSEKI